MVLRVDEAQLEARFGPFGDRADLDARLVHGLRQMYHRLKNHFGRTRWHSKVMKLKWKLDSVHLEIALISTQDSCTVYVKLIRSSKIILDAHEGTPR
jgi:hypothetical protein